MAQPIAGRPYCSASCCVIISKVHFGYDSADEAVAVTLWEDELLELGG